MRWPQFFFVLMSCLALSGCATVLPSPYSGIVSGTILYDDDIELPPGALVRVSLEDVSKVDIAAERIARHVIRNPGKSPIAFRIAYNSDLIIPEHTYAVKARILVDEQLWFINTNAYYVITQDRPSKNLEISVETVR